MRHNPGNRRALDSLSPLSGSLLASVVIGAIVACSGTATAQNALGDGTGLDNSLGQSGRTNYRRPSFARELQFRNAVVTGNAPGGLSFRGDLGYRAAGEFSGTLGSDELFSFRRDSLYSGLAGMGIRGTDALQYQFSLTTGARPPSNLVGDLSVSRSIDARPTTSATQPGTIGYDPNSVDTRGLNLYRPSVQEGALSDAMTGTLRSSSTYSSTTNLSPVVLSVFEDGIERTPYGLTASPLTGVTASPMKTNRPGEVNRSVNGGVDRTAPNGMGGQQNGRPDDGTRQPGELPMTAYQQVVERLRARAEKQAEASGEPKPADDTSLAAQLERIRMGMLGIDPDAQNGAKSANQTPGDSSAPADPGTDTADPAGMPTIDPLVERRTGQGEATNTDRPGGKTRPNDPRLYQLDQSTLDLIRDSEAPITTLVDPNAASRDLYSEHMRTGERLIRAERYFDAEERFARALAIKPGDQSAQIGRVHAQIGAGLVLSGAVNLRSILVTHPELLGTRYVGTLLPAPERVDLLINTLSARAGLLRQPGEGLEDLGVRRSAAVLLAYLGYQNDRPEVTREALGVLDEIGADDDRSFANVLRQVWLDDDSGSGDPDKP